MKSWSNRGRPPFRQLEVMRLLAGTYPMPMNAEQIAYEVGISIAHAYVMLYRMRLAGRVVKCAPATFGSVRIQP